MKKKRKKKSASLNLLRSLRSAPDARYGVKKDDVEFVLELFGKECVNYNFVMKSFEIVVSENTVIKWNTVIYDGKMFIHVPMDLSQPGSKESFVALLDIAEEEESCEMVICCIGNTGNERSAHLRTFLYMGFEPIPSSSSHLPPASHGTKKFIFLGSEL